MTKIRITSDGRVCGLWTDQIQFKALGPVRVRRVSHVEFYEHYQCWGVREAIPASPLRRWLQWLLRCPMGRLLRTTSTRRQALAWEHEYYQPGGSGWKHLRT